MQLPEIERAREINQAKGEKKRKPGLMIAGMLLLVLLITVGTAAYLWERDSLPFVAALFGSGEQEGPRYFYPMREFQVNLADPGSRRFLRMRIYLAFEEKRLEREIERRQVEIRSRVIEILRSTTVSDLDHPEGMQQLRDWIIAEINALLQNGSLTDIYFDEFIIQ